MPHITKLTLIVAMLLASPVYAQSVRLFIGPAMRGGFVDTDREVQDSIADISGRFRNTSGVTLVANRETADLVLAVVARGIGAEPWGQRITFNESYYRGTELISTPMSLRTWWVSAVLEVPAADYRKEFVGAYTHPPNLGYYGGAWRACATNLADDVMTWITANNGRLQTLRRSSSTSASNSEFTPSGNVEFYRSPGDSSYELLTSSDFLSKRVRLFDTGETTTAKGSQYRKFIARMADGTEKTGWIRR